MTDQQITALPRQFAEEMCSEMEDSFEKDEAFQRYELTFQLAVSFLKERFCLVEKSKVNEVYSTSKGYMLTYQRLYGLMPPIGDTSYAKEETKVNLLESLFPEIGKEVEG